MIVEVWTRVEVRALRDAALRMTQEQFAEQIGWSVATVRKWERATESRPVRGQRAADLDSWLARLSPEAMRRFALAISTARPPSPVQLLPTAGVDGEEDAVNRRQFGQLAAIAVAVPQSSTSRIGIADVKRLREFTSELTALDQSVGGANLLPNAVGALAQAQGLLHGSAFDEKTGRAWMSAVGELAVETGWLAHDADESDVARRCYADALSLASAADDDDLTVHAALNSALQTISLARRGEASPSYAQMLIQRAGDLVRRRPPGRIHALIAARQAAAHGVAGDRHGVARAMSIAWREMDSAVEYEPTEDCEPWLRFVTHSEVRGHEARAYTATGNHGRALALYEVTAAEPASARNAANAAAWFAAALARTGDASGAIEAAKPVLITLEKSVASPRTLRVLTPVRLAADAGSEAEEFRERFDALTTTKGRAVD
ncbi:helix-turn-helix domain-containing protein [Nocardia cyriacigeorgica]|uniref:helix-turn-helix domain-containing protein n=1 Tax=Nocardia cyriacigeorgica TaxID=135487 RepID=UPI001895F48E|nr:helix-turn-helix domain-containing protein [Nocardia cyriacigeorgica]MBF6319012.1 helix-turn-helix domain-containing protein [Nocardia cyriacigeorgica]MBF6531477.1 helix-turn-helix domain-containing protein [Nocardia cyriacigeorgica]